MLIWLWMMCIFTVRTREEDKKKMFFFFLTTLLRNGGRGTDGVRRHRAHPMWWIDISRDRNAVSDVRRSFRNLRLQTRQTHHPLLSFGSLVFWYFTHPPNLEEEEEEEEENLPFRVGAPSWWASEEPSGSFGSPKRRRRERWEEKKKKKKFSSYSEFFKRPHLHGPSNHLVGVIHV